MKHYILVSLTKPDQTKRERWQLWLRFSNAPLVLSEPPKGTQSLAENVWLIERDTGIKFLASLAHEAEQYELVYQVRFLTSDDA